MATEERQIGDVVRIGIVGPRELYLPSHGDMNHRQNVAVRRWLVYKLRELKPREGLTGLHRGIEQWFAAACLIEEIPYVALTGSARQRSRCLLTPERKTFERLCNLAAARLEIDETQQVYAKHIIEWLAAAPPRSSVLLAVAFPRSAPSWTNWLQYVVPLAVKAQINVIQFNPKWQIESRIIPPPPPPPSAPLLSPAPPPPPKPTKKKKRKPQREPGVPTPGPSRTTAGKGREGIGWIGGRYALGALPVQAKEHLLSTPPHEWCEWGEVGPLASQWQTDDCGRQVVRGSIWGKYADLGMLEAMGIHVGGYNWKYHEFRGCVVHEDALAWLLSERGRFTWDLS